MQEASGLGRCYRNLFEGLYPDVAQIAKVLTALGDSPGHARFLTKNGVWQVTADGVAALQKALPKCKIRW
jgi:hypothetical protein